MFEVKTSRPTIIYAISAVLPAAWRRLNQTKACKLFNNITNVRQQIMR